MPFKKSLKTGLVTALMLAATTEGQARGPAVYWCQLSDWSHRQVFLSDVKPTAKLNARQLRDLASRFRRTVNSQFDSFYGIDAATCSLYATRSRADLARSEQTAELERQGFSAFTINVF